LLPLLVAAETFGGTGDDEAFDMVATSAGGFVVVAQPPATQRARSLRGPSPESARFARRAPGTVALHGYRLFGARQSPAGSARAHAELCARRASAMIDG